MTSRDAVDGERMTMAVPAPPARKINPEMRAALMAGRLKRLVEHVEAYPHIVAVLDAKTRAIECAERIQWIVQRRSESLDKPWKGQSFCRTKEALLRCVRVWVPGEHPALEALPDRFQEAV